MLLGAQGYTIEMPNSDPVRQLTVQADAGVSWDQMQEYGICESFLPTNPVYESSFNGNYLFMTDAGQVELTPLPNMCTLAFTEG